jgi:hypothetical protein
MIIVVTFLFAIFLVLPSVAGRQGAIFFSATARVKVLLIVSQSPIPAK